ncbi:tyrosine-protein phosphatase [Amycolatopsis acidicola]|uniref:Tyrosine-protein phosphatase n=1 Tax=Amycolatopsis acidicola TaxID=2596893 RepID=A0A5N0V5C1_9PSEU|nr:tyrosine-protein phosphatase [Amycolatopsis acidicola]KAA9161567.1 tyrosine-protein phosphatase [Amycolatopsis acidicola]
MTSWLDLEGAANARDVGGLPTTDGNRTAPRRLLRSDNLQGLTPKDVKLLVGDLGLSTVVDLRSSREVELEGPGPLRAVGSVRHVHLSMLPEVGDATDAGAEALFARREATIARFPGNTMTALYLGYLADRPENVVAALRSIRDSEGAAIVHCAAGKDRTGVVVALALSVAGVSREDVIADYAASGERIDGILGRLRASATYARDLDKRPSSDQKPRAETMASFFDQVDRLYGGVQPWLTENGFGEAESAALREKLLSQQRA